MIQPTVYPSIYLRKITTLVIVLVSITSIISCSNKQENEQVNEQTQQQAINNLTEASEINATNTANAIKNIDSPAGKELYEEICSACHGSGILGSPKMGKATEWQSRIAKGEEALFASVMTGMGDMPPRGGASEATDNEIRDAINYIVEKSQ